MKRQILIYDIETFENLFTITFYIRKTKEYKYFIIHDSNNQYEELLEFLFSQPWIMVGFNNDNFDYPVLHHMINHRMEYSQLGGQSLAKKIYDKAQALIGEEFTAVWDNNKHIPQIDLYKIFHLDNKARRASLKDVEVAMNLPLVEDMPFDHRAWIFKDQIPNVLSYNKNDVYATWQFFELTIGNTEFPLYKGKNKIQLRQEISRRYDLPCLNWNDVKIGEQLILKLYCDTFGYNPKDIKKLRTYRDRIDLKNCIPKWAKFNIPEFNKLIKFFERSTIYGTETKDVLSFSLVYQGFKFDYGIGGLHGSIKPGIYEEDDEWGIYDWDIDGMYPNLINTQGLHPEHLGSEYNDIYDGKIVQVRMVEKKKPKKDRDFVIVEGLKLAANGTYGKLNAQESYLYDPLVAFSTTVSGQVCLTMWAERLIQASPDLIILQCNTDGITIKARRSDYQKMVDATEQLMKETNLSYELAQYKKMVIQDVNNYLAQYLDGSVKHKGLFEIDKEIYKDPSMKIVPIALKEYFINKTPIKDTIINHKNIYNFCLRLKTDQRFIPEYNYIDVNDDNRQKVKKLTRTTRYYISNHGGSLTKRKNHDGTGNAMTSVNKGYIVQLFNKFEEKEDYDINYDFYLRECRKIIDSIETKQLSLF